MLGRRVVTLVVVLMTVAAGCVGKDSDGLQGATTDVDGTGADPLGNARPEAPQDLTLLPPEDAVPAWRQVTLTVRVTGPEALARVSVVDADRPASPCTRKDAQVPGDVTLSCIFTSAGERSLVARLVVLENDAFAESAPVTITVGEGKEPGVDVTPVTLLEGGGFEVDVPVDVVLVGFEPGVAEALQAKLEPTKFTHTEFAAWQTFPPDTSSPTENVLPPRMPGVPIATSAHWRVTAAPPDVVGELVGFAAGATRADLGTGVLNGNAFEERVAQTLPGMGVKIDPNRPVMVILHGGDTLPDGHSWAYEFENGTLSSVRVFGEKEPVLVFDASAAPDPFVTSRHNTAFRNAAGQGAPSYAQPLDASGEDTVNALVRAVEDATVFRLLEGPLYPPATAPCHAVTAVLAVRGTSLSGAVTGTDPASNVDAQALLRSFEGVVGEGRAFVDVKVVNLPQDDPALAAATRTWAHDVTRYWIEENWDKYWVPHEGCEAYVSLLVDGDVTEGVGYSGVAYYDPRRDARISLSQVADLYQLATDSDGAGVVNRLLAHETGHLLGVRHPHDENTRERTGGNIYAWSSVHSVMSYQTGDRVIGFSAVDKANWERTRAAYVVQAAMADGLTEDDPAFALALDHLSRFEWRAAADALTPALAAE